MDRLRKVWKSTVVRLAVGTLAAFLLGVVFNWFKPLSLLSQGDLPAFTVTALRKDHPGGVSEMQTSIIEVFRSDGSWAKWQKAYAPAKKSTQTTSVELGYVALVPSQTRFLIVPEAESVTTFSLPEHHVRHLRSAKKCPPVPSASAPVQESSTILGFHVIRQTWPASEKPEWIVDKWFAPALNCYPLRVVVQERNPEGNTRLVQTVEAASVVLGEPDPKLFEVPPGYVERSPAAAEMEWALRRGEKLPLPPSHLIKRMDQEYYRQRNEE